MTHHTVCAIHQPNFFPRLPTLAKLYAADIWVVLDDVQFNARDYQQRTWLQDPSHHRGQWLTLPVHRPAGRASLLREVVLLDTDRTARRVQRLTRDYYGRTRRWASLRPVLEEVAEALRRDHSLVGIGELTTRRLLQDMGWHGHIVHSSTLTARPQRSHRLADLTAAVGATEYLCGTGGARYLDPAPFTEQDLTVRYLRWPDLPALRRPRNASGLWWLSAVDWNALHLLLQHPVTNPPTPPRPPQPPRPTP